LTNNKQIPVFVGLMSGTSLDGLDIAICQFTSKENRYDYTLLAAKTVSYNDECRKRLSEVYSANAFDLAKLHADLGRYFGLEVKKITKKHGIAEAVVASHGHTIFHRPEIGFTTQIGCGAQIAAHSGFDTVCDFRTIDVAKGGQGAPLVPIGDIFLFSEYDACLNLGGIANISFDNKNKQRQAFDICICNMALNYLAQKDGYLFDENGITASKGKILPELVYQLIHLKAAEGKNTSLGYEFFEKNVLPVLDQFRSENNSDLLASVCEYIAFQIADVIKQNTLTTCLVTGGGSFNKHLIMLIKQKSAAEIIIPNDEIINFKEAIVFAFLGYLRWNKQTNILKNYTGSNANSIAGAVYLSK